MNLQQQEWFKRAGLLGEAKKPKFARPTTAPSDAILKGWAKSINGHLVKEDKTVTASKVFQALEKAMKFDISITKLLTKKGEGKVWNRVPEGAVIVALINQMRPKPRIK